MIIKIQIKIDFFRYCFFLLGC